MSTGTLTRHIPYLDGWRGLAILLVMQSHFGLGGGGRFGVALFFALSGYLMGELLFVKNVALPGFFKRRFSRVVPTFWLYTAVAFVLAWFGAQRYAVPGKELVSALLFLRTYFPADVSIWAERWSIGHFWSLNVEEHSYIFLAALALVARRAGRGQLALLAATTALSLLLNCWYTLHPPGGASPWFARSEVAALGLIAAATLRVLRHRAGPPPGHAGAAWVTPLTLALAAVCFTWPAYPILQITLGPLLLAVSINYLDCAPGLVHRGLSLRPLRWFGICSFSMYIWQQLFYDAYLHGDLQRQAAGVLAILVATAAFYLYEDPVRRYLNNGSRKSSARVPGPGLADEDPLSSGRRSMM